MRGFKKTVNQSYAKWGPKIGCTSCGRLEMSAITENVTKQNLSNLQCTHPHPQPITTKYETALKGADSALTDSGIF